MRKAMLVLMLLLFASGAHAATTEFYNVFLSDVRVREGTPTTNLYGNDVGYGTIAAKSYGTDFGDRIYGYWEIHAGNLISGSEVINSFTVDIDINLIYNPSASFYLNFYYCDDANANEATVTWNTKNTYITGCEGTPFYSVATNTLSTGILTLDLLSKVESYGKDDFIIMTNITPFSLHQSEHSVWFDDTAVSTITYNETYEYVDINDAGCDDAYTRTQAQNPATPWCNITAALSNMAGGDTVLVHTGWYNYTSGLSLSTKTYYPAATIKNYGDGEVIISSGEPCVNTGSAWVQQSADPNIWNTSCITGDYVSVSIVDAEGYEMYFTNDAYADLTTNIDGRGSYWDNTDDVLFIKMEQLGTDPNDHLYVASHATRTLSLTTVDGLVLDGLTLMGSGGSTSTTGVIICELAGTGCPNFTLMNSKIVGGERGIFLRDANTHDVWIYNNDFYAWMSYATDNTDAKSSEYMETSAISGEGNGANINISNNRIHGYFNGIYMLDSAGGQFENMEIGYNNVTYPLDDSIEPESRGNCYYIHHNFISGGIAGISLAPFDSSQCPSKIEYNILNMNESVLYSAVGYYGKAFKLEDNSGIEAVNITHNTVYGLSDAQGMRTNNIANSLRNVYVRDNIFNMVGRVCYRCGDDADGTYWDYNLYDGGNMFQYYASDSDATIYTSLADAIASGNSGGTWDANSIEDVPEFVNVTNLDFRPFSTSAACGAASDGGDIGALPCFIPGYFEITATDAYSGAAISTFSATINGDNYFSTTNGTIGTNFSNTPPLTININITTAKRLQRNYHGYSTSSNLNAELAQAYANFTVSEINTSNTVSTFCVSAGLSYNCTTSGIAFLLLNASTFTYKINGSSYMNISNQLVLSTNETGIIIETAYSQHLAKAYTSTSSSINSFTARVFNTTLGIDESYSTSNGSVYFYLPHGWFDLNVTASGYDYILTNFSMFVAHNATNHTLTAWSVGNCSSPVNASISLYVYHEDYPTYPLTADLQVDILYWSLTTPEVTHQFNGEWLNNNTFYICIEPANASLQVDAIFRYTVDGGFTHYYYLINETVGEGLVNLSVYNFNTTSGLSDLKVTARNINTYGYYPNIVGSLQRRYLDEGVWKTVQMSKSGDYGLLLYDIYEQTQEYRLLFYDSTGHLLKTTDRMRFICTSSVCDLTFLLNPYSISSGQHKIVVAHDYDTDTGNLTITWDDPAGLTNNVDIRLRKPTITGYANLCSASQVGASGELECALSGYSGTAMLTVDNNDIAQYTAPVDLSGTSLATYFGDAEGALWSAGISTTVIGIGAAFGGAIGAVLATVLASAIIWLVGIFSPLTLTVVGLIAIVGIVIGLKVKPDG